MEIKSLGLRSDLIFSKFSGEIEDRGSYLLVKTPSNPGFHWGNYIIFSESPRKGDLEAWKAIFHKEFSYYRLFKKKLLYVTENL